MAKRTKSWLLVVLLALSCTALAQRAYIAIEQRLSAAQLGEVGLSAAQLELLNRYLREAEQAAPPEEAARDAPRSSTSRQDPTRFVGMDAERMVGKVKGTVVGWDPGTVFELENGQQWKVLKGSMKLRTPLQNPEIVLVPGVAGRWFLQVDEDMPKARVYRID